MLSMLMFDNSQTMYFRLLSFDLAVLVIKWMFYGYLITVKKLII